MLDILGLADNPHMMKALEHDYSKSGIVFEWYVPGCVDIDLEKAEVSGEDPEITRPIKGWCSTEALDRQEEIVVAKGLDFSEFVQFGYYNDNHKQDTASVLGEPRTAVFKSQKWWTEGNLYRGYAPADRVWELAKAMKKSGARRKLGFSIEGKVLERDGRNRILRAKVRNVAITNCPVNTECTWEAVTKSFADASAVSDAYDKALAAGHGARISGGAALRVESLEGASTRDANQEYEYNEAVEKLQRLRPHLSKSTCRRIVRYAMCR